MVCIPLFCAELDILFAELYNRYMKEPSIMKMDWKALGYEREYKDGRLRWVPQQDNKAPDDKDTSA
jgi:hypothetical protein